MKCKQCDNQTRLKRHKFCSLECYWQSLRGLKNEKAPRWKGDNVGESQIHKWLCANYDKPSMCEGKSCTGKSVYFDWALKKGKKYKKDRSHFYRLCRSCHLKYDLTEEKKKQAIKNLILHNPYGKKDSYKKYLAQEGH